MTFAALHKRVTFVYACLGFVVLARSSELSLPAMLLLALGTALAWFAEAPRIDAPSWARNLTIAVFAGFAVQVVRGLLGAELLPLALEFLGALQLTRLAARRTSTEHLHVVGLGLLHLLAGTVLTTGLDYALLFLATLVVTPWMLALTHLRAELEREHATPEELAIGTPPRLARLLESSTIVRRSFLVLSSVLAVPLFAVTAGFFVFFPRVGLGMFSFGGAGGEATAGFGNSVDLGRFGTIRDDRTVVVRILPDARSAPLRPDTQFRLRGTSFDRFDGIRWSRSPSDAERREEPYGALLLFPHAAIGHRTTELHLIAAPLDDGVYFLPEGARALRTSPKIESGITVARAVFVRPGLDVRAAELDGVDLDYSVVIDDDARDVPEALDDAMRAELVRVPSGHERLSALAASLAEGATSDAEVARRFEDHLARTGGFGYSLTTAAPAEGVRPLEHFLFASKTGHCELFASAMAILLRSRGIPARNVAGFLGGRYNAYGGYHAVMQGDAHSWVEAYVDGSFRRFDPTPAAREEAVPPPGLADTFRAMLDALRMRWARDVVGFDMRRQIEVLKSIRDFFRGPRRTEPRSIAIEDGNGPASSRTRPRSIPVAPIALGIAALALVALVVRRIRAARPAPIDEAARFYLALDRALEAHGLARPPTRTPEEHLAFVAREGFAELDAVAFVTRIYARARYEGVAPTDDERRAVPKHLRAIRRSPRTRPRPPGTPSR